MDLLSVPLAYEPLFSEGDHNHSLGENFEKGLINLDLRPSRGRQKNIFSLFYSYTVPTRRWAGKGRLCKWLIFGGPCRGRTYGPLIKRCPVDQTQQTQEDVSAQKNKESE
jgi:hypothetical protein